MSLNYTTITLSHIYAELMFASGTGKTAED